MRASMNQALSRLLTLQTGDLLQHARSLLWLNGSHAGGMCSSNISNGVPEPFGGCNSAVRSVYTGKTFIRDNLRRPPPQGNLFTRENYQFLESQRWSMSAREQILKAHVTKEQHTAQSLVIRQLHQNLEAATDMQQLQALLVRHAHQMNAPLFAQVACKAPRLLKQPNKEPDYAAAAVVLNLVAGHLQPNVTQLSGRTVCYVLAAFVKCRCSPPADMLKELLQTLVEDDCYKMQQCEAPQLVQLLLALDKLVKPQNHWPVMQAVLQQATLLLKQQLREGSGKAIRSSSNEPASLDDGSELDDHTVAVTVAAAVAAGEHGFAGKHQLQQQQQAGIKKAVQASLQQQDAIKAHNRKASIVNSTALLAVLLDKYNTDNTEYLNALRAWIGSAQLKLLYPQGVINLWIALKGQWVKQERTQRSSAAATAATAPRAAADAAEFLGRKALSKLAAATVPLVSSMTEVHQSQLMSYLGRLRYCTPELIAAVTEGFTNLLAATSTSHVTKVNALWAATQLQQFRPLLMLPALLEAVQYPERLDGFLAARVIVCTSQMPPAILKQMRSLLRQEQHRLSGARGPAPTAVVAADPATAAADVVPEWVDSLANSLSGRMAELRPHALAHILLYYNRIHRIALHEKMFAAAAEHIESHAHGFTSLDDMEMIATAFDALSFKAGLPALQALQKQSEQLGGAM